MNCLEGSIFLIFLVIACKPMYPTYLAALNPTDQVFDFEELEYHYLVANRTEDVPAGKDDDDDDDDDENDSTKGDGMDQDSKEKIDEHEDSPIDMASPQMKSPNIDNPYLKAAKVPRTKSEACTSLNFG